MTNSFSILIPIYNFDVNALVGQLHKQALATNQEFQILLIDDCSKAHFKLINEPLANFDFVQYIPLEKNIGRSKIRNLLFSKAKFNNCLVLDCDVEIIENDFLEKYFEKLSNNVVVGGHVYEKEPPKNKAKYFHWLYGSTIESKPANIREQNPYHSFMSSSFVITKDVFEKIKFNENISEYGHEDTLFGIELKKQNIPILHIENTVVHLGLDYYLDFIKKQEKAIQNLAYLYSINILKKDLESLKIIRYHNSILNKFPFNVTLHSANGFINFYSKIFNNDKLKLLNFSFWKLEKFNSFMNF